jgi:anaerobic ribonucleoside-triphosphate reductase activating protein
MKRYGPILARSDAINVAHMVERCRVLGPGERFVLWVQGCPLRCPGCHNPQFLAFRRREWVLVENIARQILGVPDLEGVTFVGGEPFAQAHALASLARILRPAGLSVMAYSGFTFEELIGGVMDGADRLLASADLLTDGRYVRELPTHRPWRGSDNQRLIALSDRYAGQVAMWNEPSGQEFEVRLSTGGSLEVLGIPPPLPAASSKGSTGQPPVPATPKVPTKTKL